MKLPGIKLVHNRTFVIATVIVAVMIVIAAWVMVFKPGNKAAPPSFEEVLSTGMGYSSSGDVDAGLAYYDEQLERHEDKSEKQQILIHKSTLALNAGKNDVAIESAKAAEQIEPNIASLKALAQAYDTSGDKRQAIAYYKKLIEITSDESMASRYKGDWAARIEELEVEINP